jgi:hypothetical protein
VEEHKHQHYNLEEVVPASATGATEEFTGAFLSTKTLTTS